MEWRDDLGYSWLIFRRGDGAMLGGVTLSNVRRGVAQSGSLGYWIGQPHAHRARRMQRLPQALRERERAQHRLDRVGALARIAAGLHPPARVVLHHVVVDALHRRSPRFVRGHSARRSRAKP